MKHSKLIALILFIMPCAVGHAYTPLYASCKTESKEWVQKVVRVQKETSENIKDMDGDGVLNCKDYSILFKVTWDKYYNKSDCLLTRNYNTVTGFHHLFVRVWDEKSVRYIDVETVIVAGRGYVHENRCMWCVWGKSYDRNYNYYDENDRWLYKRW